MRADAGFFDQRLLEFLEQRGLSYIVVARLTLWLKREAARVTAWRALDPHYAVGEFSLQLFGWDRPRRFVVIREQLRAERPSLGRKLLEVPGYTFRVFVTNLLLPPEEIWRDYNRRTDMGKPHRGTETRSGRGRFLFAGILRHRSGLPQHPAAVQPARGISARRPGHLSPATLRSQVFLWGALLGRAGHRLVLHLSSSWGGLQRRIPLLEHVLTYGTSTSPKLHPQPATCGSCVQFAKRLAAS